MKYTSAKAVVAASVAVMAASSAHASIVYTDIPDIHVLASSEMGQHTTTGTFIIDSAQGTGLGLTVFVDRGPPIVGVTSAYTTITLLGGTGCLLGITQFGLFEPYSLAAGSSIGPIVVPPPPPPPPTREWTTSTAAVLYLSTYQGLESQNQGFWTGTAYLGISLPAPGGVRYGWVGMSASTNHITIFDFAYETNINTPIVAGAVPAPGTLVVAGLALVGARTRRGRRGALAGSQ